MAFVKKSITAGTPSSVKGQTTKLDIDSKGERLVYCSGRSVFIRSLKDPSICTEYVGHIQPTTVARFSPSGFYVASGDITGNVRVWDCAGTDQVLKVEVKVIAGRISDLAWDGESKRIIAVGEGKERYGHAFTFDTGSSVGEISGHFKVINAVAIKPQRPFRAVTVSDDMTAVFLHGAPYKYNKVLKAHTRFLQDVAYSHDGEHFVTVGSDAKVVLYDGKTGDVIEELTGGDVHTGTIYAVSFSPDDKHIVTSSADATIKVWNIAEKKVIETYAIATSPSFETHQVGNAWSKDGTIISMSFNGDLHYIDRESKKISKTIKGHQKSITAMARGSDGTIYTGSYEGIVYGWPNNGTGDAVLQDISHTNQITGLVVAGDKLFSIGMDDSLRVHGSSVSTGYLPKAVAAVALQSGSISVAVATVKDVQLFEYTGSSLKKVASLPASGFTPQSTAIHPTGTSIAVGAVEDNKVRIYGICGTQLSSLGEITSTGPITALAFTPVVVSVREKSTYLLAAGSATGKIYAYDDTNKAVITQWVFHTSRINSLVFSADGQYCLSSSLDTNVDVYSVAKPMRNLQIKNAHALGATGAVWSGEEIISSGTDSCLKTWSVKLPV